MGNSVSYCKSEDSVESFLDTVSNVSGDSTLVLSVGPFNQCCDSTLLVWHVAV